MKKDKKKNNAPITSLPDELHSVWELAGALKKEAPVSEEETEQALQDIWSKVDTVQKPATFPRIQLAVAAITVIAALVGFLHFFTIEKVSTPGQLSIIELPDGSSLTLNGNSKVQYSLLFGITHRAIEMDGHAHFDVISNERLPFIITSPSLTTTVLGTIFEIEDWNKAEHSQASVFVHEGRVEVQNNSATIDLTQNQEARVVDDVLIDVAFDESSSGQSVNWSESRVNFKNMPLNEFFERLSLQFGVDIQINERVDLQERVSGSYRFDTSLHEILLDVATIKNLQAQRTNNGFVIK